MEIDLKGSAKMKIYSQIQENNIHIGYKRIHDKLENINPIGISLVVAKGISPMELTKRMESNGIKWNGIGRDHSFEDDEVRNDCRLVAHISHYVTGSCFTIQYQWKGIHY